MWPLKSTNINTFSHWQIEIHIFQQILTLWSFYTSLSGPSSSIFWSISIFTCIFAGIITVKARTEVGVIQAWFPAVASIVWTSVLSLLHLSNWTISSAAGASFVIMGIHLSSLFSHQIHLAVTNYHFDSGHGELLPKLPFVWWKPIQFAWFFSEHTCLPS